MWQKPWVCLHTAGLNASKSHALAGCHASAPCPMREMCGCDDACAGIPADRPRGEPGCAAAVPSPLTHKQMTG